VRWDFVEVVGGGGGWLMGDIPSLICGRLS